MPGGLDKTARAVEFLIEALVKAVGHHESRNAATGGGQVLFESLDALGGGKAVFPLRMKQVGAREVEFDVDFSAFRAERFHGGPTIGQAGGFQVQVAAADGPFPLLRGQQRAG